MSRGPDKQPDAQVPDPLALLSVFPDAEPIFRFRPESLEAVQNTASVVLDTNALLVPYGTSKESLKQIKKVYTSLTAERRLIVPGQVAREFAKNRSEKLKTLFQQLSRKRNLTSPTADAYPLLEDSAEYKKVQQMEAELSKKIDAYRSAVAALLEYVRSWNWDDPVSTLYREVFASGVTLDVPDPSKLLAEFETRFANRIPPGYKDSSKDDSGIGDFLIWQTILKLASQKQHVIFVSGDEKSDWWHQSENQALYPRFELVDEFRRRSDGKSFHLISFAKFLSLFGASKGVVEEVRVAEEVIKEQELVNLVADDVKATPWHVARKAAHDAIAAWVVTRYPGELSIRPTEVPHLLIRLPDGSVRGFHPLVVTSPQAMLRGLSDVYAIKLAGAAENLVIVVAVLNESRLPQICGMVNKYPELTKDVGVVIGSIRSGRLQVVLEKSPSEPPPGRAAELLDF